MENVLRVIIILWTGIAFGDGKETVIALFSFIALRMHAGGIHAKSSTGCTLFTSCIVLGGVLAEQYVPNYICFYLVCYIMSNGLIYKYAPNGSESCTLLDSSYKEKKKIYALITNQILFVISYIFSLENLILMPVMAECLSLVVFEWRRTVYEKGKKDNSECSKECSV